MTEWGLNAETAKIVAWTVGVLITAVYGNSFLRRKLSGDKREIANNEGEVSLIARQQQEIATLRERFDRATEERNRAIEELGGLRSQVLSLSVHIERLERQVVALQDQIKSLLEFREISERPPVKFNGGKDEEAGD